MRPSLLLTGFSTLAFALAQNSTSKRGLVHVPSRDHPQDDQIWIQPGNGLVWYYNYKDTPSQVYADSNLEFVPMLWGNPSSATDNTFLASIRSQLNSGARIRNVLAFNEPDGNHDTGGSNVASELAAATWIREIEPLRALGIKLGAPAVTGSQRGIDWLKKFFENCDGRCTVDFIPVHFYGSFEGMASHIGQVMGLWPDAKVWVTEYAYAHQNLVESQNFARMTNEYFDRMENITRYSYFGSFRSNVANVGANAAMLTERGELTDIGASYLGRPATGNIPHATGAASAGVDKSSFVMWTSILSAVIFWGFA